MRVPQHYNEAEPKTYVFTYYAQRGTSLITLVSMIIICNEVRAQGLNCHHYFKGKNL